MTVKKCLSKEIGIFKNVQGILAPAPQELVIYPHAEGVERSPKCRVFLTDREVIIKIQINAIQLQLRPHARKSIKSSIQADDPVELETFVYVSYSDARAMESNQVQPNRTVSWTNFACGRRIKMRILTTQDFEECRVRPG